jgi:hypothetical protein
MGIYNFGELSQKSNAGVFLTLFKLPLKSISNDKGKQP